ncbi:MAG: site-2 protease family protein [Acidobacteriota bacterium]
MSFALTLLTTTVMGPYWTHPDLAEKLPLLTPRAVVEVLGSPELLAHGLSFALPVLFILGCHEWGHWWACRRHGLVARPPVFLPAPLAIGTFGAFIRILQPVRNRRQLLEVGASGPWAGLVAVLPLLLWRAVSPPGPGAATGDIELAEPLALRLTRLAFGGDIWETPILSPDPLLFALWIGLLVTAFNLLPLGQLDGGHVLYALLGSRQHLIGQLLWLALLIGGWWWPGWWVWALITLLTGLKHPPTRDPSRPLGKSAALFASATLLLWVLVGSVVPLRAL